MDKIVQKVIERISNIDVANEVELLGDIICDILFETNKHAFYIEQDSDRVSILLPIVRNKAQEQKEILLFTELLAVLEDLKNNHLIYVSKDTVDNEQFFYQGKVFFDKDQRPNVYKIANNVSLSVPAEGELTLIENGRVVMSGVPVDSQIGSSLATFLMSRVLPTNSLKEYVKRGFLTKEEKYTRRGLKYSIISMVIAISIATISPLLSVFVSNQYGISTLKQQQLDSLINKAKPVYVITTVNKEKIMCDSTKNNPEKITPKYGNK